MSTQLQVSEQEAIRACAEELRQTREFTEFERCAFVLQADARAQDALQALQAKQDALRALKMLNAVGDADRLELQRLETAVSANPVINAYQKAQTQAAALCREVNERISGAIGMRFALKLSSCCG